MRTRLVLAPFLAMAVPVAMAACTGDYADDQNTGGSSGTGGAVGGTNSSGGSSGASATGGSATGGTAQGGASSGGTSTGGTSPTGGSATGGAATGGGGGMGGAATGGDSATGGAGTGGMAATSGAGPGGAGSGGAAAGSAGKGGGGGAGGSPNAMGPCDIYGAANPATPCVAAYSTVRRLRSAYAGPLYQVRRGAPAMNTGSGGQTQDIPQTADGFADAAAQDAFCGTQSCTFSILYDQSGRGNNLTVAKAGCYNCNTNPPDSACTDDYESNAKRRPMTAAGRNVYALYMDVHEGYRTGGVPYPQTSPPGAGMPTGEAAQGIYMVAEGSGKRPGAGCCCCWNFGNASTNNCYGPSGQMNALFLGTGYWGRGAGSGPWFMGDFEAGVWAGGTGASNVQNPSLPSMTMNYAFGILKSNSTNYAIRVGDANTGNVTTAYDGALPAPFGPDGEGPQARWSMDGGIILGIGGDNSNHSTGTFLEGAITAGRPTDATDAAVHANVKALAYGQ